MWGAIIVQGMQFADTNELNNREESIISDINSSSFLSDNSTYGTVVIKTFDLSDKKLCVRKSHNVNTTTSNHDPIGCNMVDNDGGIFKMLNCVIESNLAKYNDGAMLIHSRTAKSNNHEINMNKTNIAGDYGILQNYSTTAIYFHENSVLVINHLVYIYTNIAGISRGGYYLESNDCSNNPRNGCQMIKLMMHSVMLIKHDCKFGK